MADCLFCRIIRGEVPSKKVYEDEHTYAFEDLNPQGPTHVLVIPKKHISGLKEAVAGDAEVVGRCHLAAAQIARERSIEDGYRTVLNVGPRAGQSVFHLHVHLIGGRPPAAAPCLRRPFPPAGPLPPGGGRACPAGGGRAGTPGAPLAKI